MILISQKLQTNIKTHIISVTVKNTKSHPIFVIPIVQNMFI